MNKIIKKYLICSFLLITFGILHISEVQAQSFLERFWQNNKKHIIFSEEYDDTAPFFIGISGEVAYSHYSIEKAANWNVDNFTSITVIPGPEYGLGIPVRIRLNNYFSVSTGAYWFFVRGNGTNRSGTRLEYTDPTNNVILYQRESGTSGLSNRSNFNTMEFPLHLKLYSDRKYWSQNSREPYRVYLLGGIRFTRNLDAKQFNTEPANFDKVSEIPLNFKTSYYNLEGGVGYDLYSRYFKASVELRYSESMGDLLDRDRYGKIIDALHKSPEAGFTNPHMDAIHRLDLRGWRLSIILE